MSDKVAGHDKKTGSSAAVAATATSKMMGKIMLEVVPPSKRASSEAISRSVEKISSEVNKLKCINYINIPEIIEENFEARPYYRNIDTRLFGRRILEETGRKIILNKVIAHLPKPQFERWVEETVLEYGILGTIFVGGSRRGFSYVGPSVVEANQYAADLALSSPDKFEGLEVGNILIPGREAEVDRAVLKTETGCSFFTTQIIFQPKSFNNFAKGYCKECTKKKLKRSLVFLSFAPVRTLEDIKFFKWLGCDIPPKVIERFQKSGDIERTSIEIAKETLSDILVFIEKNKLDVPVGLNIESVFLRNLPLALEMIESFSPLILQGKS